MREEEGVSRCIKKKKKKKKKKKEAGGGGAEKGIGKERLRHLLMERWK